MPDFGSFDLSHLGTGIGGVLVGAIGFFRERERRLTAKVRAEADAEAAEKRLEEAEARAMEAAAHAFRATAEQAQSMASEALAMAKTAKKEADDCDTQHKECSNRLDALHKEFEDFKHQYLSSGVYTGGKA